MGNAKRVLNWGILSTATINRSLIPAIRESNGNNVFAIASRKYETAIKFAKKWDVQKVFKSYSELLDDSEIDVVYVPLPNSMHAEWAVKAMKAGKHVLCEKPLALSTVQVDDMTRVAHENDVVLSEALMYRHSNEVLEVKKLIEDGAIGSLCFVRGLFRVNTNYSVDNIRFHGELGGGSLWDIGYYPVSFARYVIGCKPKEVFGYKIVGEAGVDTTFMGQLRFPNNIYSQFYCSFYGSRKSEMEFVGSKGAIYLDNSFTRNDNKKIVISNGDGNKEVLLDCSVHRYLGEVKDMYNAIVLEKPQQINQMESRDNVETVVSLLESANEDKVVSV